MVDVVAQVPNRPVASLAQARKRESKSRIRRTPRHAIDGHSQGRFQGIRYEMWRLPQRSRYRCFDMRSESFREGLIAVPSLRHGFGKDSAYVFGSNRYVVDPLAQFVESLLFRGQQ